MGSDTEGTWRTAFCGWILCVCMETNKIRQNVLSQPSGLCSQPVWKMPFVSSASKLWTEGGS